MLPLLYPFIIIRLRRSVAFEKPDLVEFRRLSVGRSVSPLVTNVYFGKTTDLTEMLSGWWVGWAQRIMY